MTKSAIASVKRAPTSAERLRDADPTLADLFDALEAVLAREYDLDLAQAPPVPIVASETALAVELGELDVTAGRLYAAVEQLHATADVARATLARIALDTVPPPSGPITVRQLPATDSFDGGPASEDFHDLHEPATATATADTISQETT